MIIIRQQDDFELVPFSRHSGLGRAHRLFGNSLLAILDELNNQLAAKLPSP